MSSVAPPSPVAIWTPPSRYSTTITSGSAVSCTASTEQVAAEAGVAIGTIFRHFPTKADLLAAIMKDTLARLAERMAAPDATLSGAFTALVAEAAAKRAVIDLLPGLEVADSVAQF